MKVSVLMPVYNGEAYLSEAIESILNQSFIDFEFIIINDGSTDGTDRVIKNYKDNRIVYIINEKNIGIINTLNKGILIAKGDYIVRMDHDDFSMKDRIKAQVAFMESNPNHVLVGSNIIINNQRILKFPFQDEEIRVAMLINTTFAHPSVIIRSAVLKKYSIQYSHDYIHAEDYGMWIELSKFGKLANLDQVLINYRKHSSQISAIHQEKSKESCRKIRIYYLEILNVNLDEKIKNILLKFFDSNYYFSDSGLLRKEGKLLIRLPELFSGTSLNEKYLIKLSTKIWIKKCMFISNKFKAYQVFVENKLSRKVAIKTHLAFIKQIIFKTKWV